MRMYYFVMSMVDLVRGGEGVDVGGLWPGHRSHLHRRIQLHRAAA